MLAYITQKVVACLGTKATIPPGSQPSTDPTFVITPVTLTAAYGGNVSPAINTGKMSELTFDIEYVAGTNATALDLKLEFSNDTVVFSLPVNWFQETTDSAPSSGVITETPVIRSFTNGGLVAGTTYKFRIVVPVASFYARISAQEVLSSGTAFGSIFIEAVTSGF